MKENPRAGATATGTFVVEANHAIDFGPPAPAVLSTPSLIWHLEHAAIEALKPFLAPGEISLGTAIDIQHLSIGLPRLFQVMQRRLEQLPHAQLVTRETFRLR